MKTLVLTAAALAALVVTVPADQAQAATCQQRAHNARVTGTVLGAVGGALLGNAVSHHGGGALVGGVGGAVVGNQMSRRSCDGYYYRHTSRHYRRSSGYDNRYRNAAGYTPASSRCSVRNVNYYNERGELMTRQVESCR